MVTIPRSVAAGVGGAGSRSPKQEAWGGGRKAGLAEWGTLGPGLPELCSGCGERRRKQLALGVGVGKKHSSLDPDIFPSPSLRPSLLSAPAHEGLGMPCLSSAPPLPSLNNSCLQANSIKVSTEIPALPLEPKGWAVAAALLQAG